MANFTPRSLAVIAALLLAGCGSLPEEKDETAGWSAQRIYSEASEAMTDGGYDRAIAVRETRSPLPLWAIRAAGPARSSLRLPQVWRGRLAVAACDRFIKLHPDHPNVDYAYYLKGLVHFNEDLGLLGNLANQDLSERDPAGAKESFDTFRELVNRFPDSKYAADASQRMQYLVNALGPTRSTLHATTTSAAPTSQP